MNKKFDLGKYTVDISLFDDDADIRIKEVWTMDGVIHRSHGPAIVLRDRNSGEAIQEEWYCQGELHREDAPAVVFDDGHVSEEKWFANGLAHRVGGPAVRQVNKRNGVVFHEEWLERGQNHRVNGPSSTMRDLDTGAVVLELWYVDSKLHREDGHSVPKPNLDYASDARYLQLRFRQWQKEGRADATKQLKLLRDIVCGVQNRIEVESQIPVATEVIFNQIQDISLKNGFLGKHEFANVENKKQFINNHLTPMAAGRKPRVIAVYLAWLCRHHKDEAQSFYEEVGLGHYREYVDGDDASVRDDTASTPDSTQTNGELAVRPDVSSAARDTEVSDTTKQLDPELSDRRDEFRQRIHENLADHTPHDIEAKFEEFLETHDRGYWLLTAGPGMGKTVVMSSLMTRLSQHFFCVPYFFRQDFSRSEENNISGFCDYFRRVVAHEFGLGEAPPVENEKEYSRFLKRIFFRLNHLGFASPEKPIILFIDALDEMDIEDGRGASESNPLQLPRRLPPGIFVACSTRFNIKQKSAKLRALPVGVTHVNLELEDNFDAHIRTVKKIRAACV